MKSASIALVVAAAVMAGSVATAQNVLPAKKVDGYLEVGNNPITGEGVTVDLNTSKKATAAIYTNTTGNGWYSTSTPAIGSIWHSWGILTAADATAASNHNCVVALGLGYVSSLSTGGTTAIIFYAFDNSTGWCSANGLGTLQFAVYVYGLPGTYPTWGATGWTFTIPLENLGGSGASFCFEQGQGPIGYGYDFVDNANTGVNLVGRPNPTGEQDAFDFYDSTGATCTGTYWFGGYGATNPFASFYVRYDGFDSWLVPYGASCADGSGGVWTITGSGCTCDGSAIGINIASAGGSGGPHSAALVVGLGNASTLSVFGTGCTYDVPGAPSIFVLGPIPTGVTLPGLIAPNGLTGLTFTLQLLMKDTATGTISSNPLELNVF